MSKKRARSKKDKETQLKFILSEARELFISEGSKGFSMRALAKCLQMSQSNLYNYWSSKRELWFDIVKTDFLDFRKGLVAIVMNHQGLFIDLFMKLSDFYFNFARENYTRYQMMFVTPPPPVENGVDTQSRPYEPDTISILMEILTKAADLGKLEHDNVENLALYLWSVVHGTALVSNSILFQPATEIATFGVADKFQAFVKEIVSAQLSQFISE